MANIILIVIISALGFLICSRSKCYDQRCTEEGDGYKCIRGNKTHLEGDIYDDEIGCNEELDIRDGKIYQYSRLGIQGFEGYNGETRDDFKEGCVTGTYEILEEKHEYEQCYCFKEFCNAKNKIPDGSRVDYDYQAG